eukprot:4433368-Amphidinium_carterae.1
MEDHESILARIDAFLASKLICLDIEHVRLRRLAECIHLLNQKHIKEMFVQSSCTARPELRQSSPSRPCCVRQLVTMAFARLFGNDELGKLVVSKMHRVFASEPLLGAQSELKPSSLC